MNVVEEVLSWGTRTPGKTAIDCYGDAWSYARLTGEIEQCAAAVRAEGIRPGDVVLVFLPQGPDAIAVYFGLMRAGAVPSFMPLPSAKQEPHYYWSSHRQLLEVIRPAAILTLQGHLAAMRESGFAALVPRLLAREGLLPGAPAVPAGTQSRLALLQHSSGTTSLKKGVALTHEAITTQVRAYRAALDLTPEDVVVSWLPMYHDMGLIACTVTPLMLGQKVVLLDPFRWVSEPASLLMAIARHRGTLCWLPNFAFELLAKTVRYEPGSLDLSSMRAFIDCSEPCKPASLDRFLATFRAAGVSAEALQVCYAMAETVFAVTQTPCGQPVRRVTADAARLSGERRVFAPAAGAAAIELLSAGPPIEGMTIRIVDPDGISVPDGHVGEIELSSSFLFDGYFHRPELTARKMRAGSYRTGDIGFLLEGELYVLGRNDDLIIVHGRNYFSHEVEAIANGIAGLKAGRNVAVGVFNESMGSHEVVLIAEAEEPGAGKERHLQVRRAAKAAVAAQMGLELRDVRIVEAGWLAKTSSGKISRSLNLEKYLRETSGS